MAERGEGARPPSPWVLRWSGRIPRGGAVLDVACGRGRHTRALLARGHRVTAVDRDLSGVADLADQPCVELLEADLEAGTTPFGTGAVRLAGRRFDGVVVTNYLHRPLLGALVDAVAPGGALIYETFAQGHERFGRPTDPRFLLAPGELLGAVAGQLRVIAYEDVVEDAPTRRAAVQRICATRARPPGGGSGAEA